MLLLAAALAVLVLIVGVAAQIVGAFQASALRRELLASDSGLEQRVADSVGRVADQVAAMQRALGHAQAFAEQASDLRRLFGNVRVRGGWGEAQLGALLDDMLPADAFVRGYRPRVAAGGAEVVEFALRLPRATAGAPPVWLPIDSKFPTEDYERLLDAAEAGDRSAEAQARAGLARRLHAEAARIGGKYLAPPETADFAVLYLPSDSLFAEAARIPGLLTAIRQERRVLVSAPSLLPAFLHSLRVGHLTIALDGRAAEIGRTLQAVRLEWERLAAALDATRRQAETLARGIEAAQARARTVGRTLEAAGGVVTHAVARTDDEA
jgi:DNA recombination protein RmuC